MQKMKRAKTTKEMMMINKEIIGKTNKFENFLDFSFLAQPRKFYIEFVLWIPFLCEQYRFMDLSKW